MKKKILAFVLTALAVFVGLQLSGCEQKADGACPAGCTKSCCAGEDAEAKACPDGCTKPCCAEAKACPDGCTKSCCAVKTAEEAVSNGVADAGEQTLCPIMKGPIDKDIFVEYKGKKVYFCCAGCEDAFNKDPEKYTKLLPQFQ